MAPGAAPARPRARVRWRWARCRRAPCRRVRRCPGTSALRELLATYLPLLLMAAAGAGHLVAGEEHAAGRCAAAQAPLPRQEPDYTMSASRSSASTRDGRLKLRIAGRATAPLPDHRHARDRRRAHPCGIGPTAASRWRQARRARGQRRRQRSAADRRRAAVDSTGAARRADRVPRRVPACLPDHRAACARTCRCVVQRDGSEFRAAGMEYDHLPGSCSCRASACTAAAPARRRSQPRGERLSALGRGRRHRSAQRCNDRTAGLHHRRVQRHRPGAGRCASPAPAGAWRWWPGAAPSCRPGSTHRAWPPSAPASTPPTCATSTASSPPASACIAEQGLPDVVIANAGISVGMDTAEFDDLDVMRAHLRDQQPGHGRHLPPLRGGHAPARQRPLVGIASVAGIRGLPGHGAYCASKAAVISYCESLRGECRRLGRARW